ASQAVISGAYSLTREAVQLDLLPRVRVLQTSEEAKGQIFVPAANMFLFLTVELAFLVGNLTKIPTGGWVPLAFAVLMFAMFITWRDGRQKLRAELEHRAVPDKK